MNFTLVGNPLPSPPHTYDDTPLREDYSEGRIDDADTKRYRHHILSLFQIQVGAEEKTKVRLIVLDSKRVKMKWSHSVNPDSELLEDSVDLEDIGTVRDINRKGTEAGSGIGTHRLPKKKGLSKMGRLSRSGMVKEEPKEEKTTTDQDKKKSSKRKHSEEEVDGDNVEKKEKKIKKSKKSKKDTDEGREDQSIAKSQFSHDSGVVGVEFQVPKRVKEEVGVDIADHGTKKKNKDDKAKMAGGVDLSVLSGASSMEGFGTGGSSAWD